MGNDRDLQQHGESKRFALSAVGRHLLIEFTGEVVNCCDTTQFDNFRICITFLNSESSTDKSLELQHFGGFLFSQQIDL